MGALLATALAPPAQAADLAATARALDRQMRLAGAASGAFVMDLNSGDPVYARFPDTARIPASVNKLYTTAAALTRFGTDHQLVTEVRATAQPDEAGVIAGNLYLRGGGDPTFGAAEARSLARVLAGSGLTEVTGRVIGDETYFDGLRGVPASSWRTSRWIGPLTALVFNRALTLGRPARYQTQPALYAAAQFERALERAAVAVRRRARAAATPSQAVLVGEWASPPMSALVAQTNGPSDNFTAETLLKSLGAEFGTSGSTASGTRVATDVAAEFDAHPRMVDGSGLSRGNRTTPRDVVELLAGIEETEVGDEFAASLAVAGRTGTLEERMRRTAARGRCRAKTGTLIGISALAGYCEGRSGSRTAFAFLMQGVSVTGAHALQDRMTATLARYRAAAVEASR
jgi:D-alanyl-D-alanine carboxypeptidase/D-alanyl-D-alanine-endopeptidase (penicillin-binding protein 4)